MHVLHAGGMVFEVSSFSVSRDTSHQTTMSGVSVVKGERLTVSVTIPSPVRVGSDSFPYAILSTDDGRVQMTQFSPLSTTMSENETEVDAAIGDIQYV
jgi:hypothetical protein